MICCRMPCDFYQVIDERISRFKGAGPAAEAQMFEPLRAREADLEQGAMPPGVERCPG